jgi:DNA modification methylase
MIKKGLSFRRSSLIKSQHSGPASPPPSGGALTPGATPPDGMKIEWWPVGRVIPYARNARVISQAAVDKVAASLAEFGWRQPIVVDEHAVILAGHTRLQAAHKCGFAHVPVHVAAGLSEAQARAYRLMDNRSHEEATWDEELLSLELLEIKGFDFDLDLTGFNTDELDELLADKTPGLTDPDAAPPLPEVATTQRGDLYELGKHRLLCGDATHPDHVARLLNGARPMLMITDPPYGIELDSEWRDRAGLNGSPGQKRTKATKERDKSDPRYPSEPSYMKHRTEGHTNTTVSGDTRADWSEAFELVPSLQIAYVWHASLHTHEVLDGLLRIGFLYPQQIIWDKGRVVLTRTHYWFQHEPCWYVRKKNAPWYGEPGAGNSSIWRAESPKFIMGSSDEEKFDHPTQKPVMLATKPILNHTHPADLVYEPFCGSGTTLIACEMTARSCYAFEIEPQYCDVIVQRWEEFSGKKAIRHSQESAQEVNLVS